MKVSDGRNASMAIGNAEYGAECAVGHQAAAGVRLRRVRALRLRLRCPGEQLTIQVFEDFLRKVWRDKITFHGLNLPNPGRVPIGPNAVIDDNITFARSS